MMPTMKSLAEVVDAYSELQKAKKTKNQTEITKALTRVYAVFRPAERDAELSAMGQKFAALRIAHNEAVRTKAPDRQQREDALIKAVVEYAALKLVVNAYEQVQALKAQKADQKKLNEAIQLLYKAVR